MPVVGGDACRCGQSDQPFEAETDVKRFRAYGPCRQAHVRAEAPSAVGEFSEAGCQVVGLVFGLGVELFSEFAEDVCGSR